MVTGGGGNRLRTVWTPEMDRYFINLLLEQMKEGNKFDDHLFSKRAWKHMTARFNAKFKFRFQKDVLKNRHKTLRNLYRSVARLLHGGQGFSWDEDRQMLTADNCVWKEQIKIHPQSRALRIKSVPYYRNLQLIFGEPSQEIPLDDGREEETLNASSPTAGNRGRTFWQPRMDRYFIDLMLDQLRRGNQMEGVFRKQAWMEMIASFNSNFGFRYEVDALKNRYKTLRRQYNVIKGLLQLDGFAWDDGRWMVTADESVWQDYIKTHTDARQYMSRPVPYYKDLCMICMNGGSESLLDSGGSPSVTEMDDDHGEILVVDLNNKRRTEGQLESSYPNKSRGRERSNIVEQQCVSIEHVVEAVQALADMDEELILDACDLLEDDLKAKTFMALDANLRKKWLLRKLRP